MVRIKPEGPALGRPRSAEPAAFVTDPRVPYTTADNLAQVLTAPDDPAPDWIPPLCRS